jgi:hypothetical protein
MGDVRRWDVNEWELRDVTALTYLASYSPPIPEALERAIQAVQDRVAQKDEPAIKASQLLERTPQDIHTAVRMALERNAAGEGIEDWYVQAWVQRAKAAVLYAIVGHLAKPWIRREEAETLTAAYRAADERLDFDFQLETRDEQQWEAAKGFLNDVVATFPGTTATFDPPHRRPPQRFDVIGTAYLPGDADEARERLIRNLGELLHQRDPDQGVHWPSANFNCRRPTRFGVGRRPPR